MPQQYHKTLSKTKTKTETKTSQKCASSPFSRTNFGLVFHFPHFHIFLCSPAQPPAGAAVQAGEGVEAGEAGNRGGQGRGSGESRYCNDDMTIDLK